MGDGLTRLTQGWIPVIATECMQSHWPILLILRVLVSLLIPWSASASTAVDVETRLWAFEFQTPVRIGAEWGLLSADSTTGYNESYGGQASGYPLVPRGTLQKIFEIQRGKGNFGIGQLTRGQADEVGRAFVGQNAVDIVKGGKVIGVSSPDGLRVFRFPAAKTRGQAAGAVQANVEEFFINAAGKKVQVRNAHIDIVP